MKGKFSNKEMVWKTNRNNSERWGSFGSSNLSLLSDWLTVWTNMQDRDGRPLVPSIWLDVVRLRVEVLLVSEIECPPIRIKGLYKFWYEFRHFY